ncbi:MAG: alpha/beta hydrolase [Alphaproteobacteria bacterium]|nr:MAG: alpha/beta hydrolase [Alphaproteobacteria bacterium]
MTIDLFHGFRVHRTEVEGEGGAIHAVVGGDGPPVLLLHGHPQTHAMWHRVAPVLARDYTVVCADLRGYGDSLKPRGGGDHSRYAKRRMAADMVAVMADLGFQRFRLVGHDRGGRVAHRLARDHRSTVSHLAVLDIAPTLAMYEATDRRFATAYWHWFFLIQPEPLPETLLAGNPAAYLTTMLGRAGQGVIDPRALADYLRCNTTPDAIHAMCEDYRAAASIDLDHDREDLAQPLTIPLLVLWGADGVVARCFDPIEMWGAVALSVTGHAVPTGHYLAEEDPDAVLAALVPFLATDG